MNSTAPTNNETAFRSLNAARAKELADSLGGEVVRFTNASGSSYILSTPLGFQLVHFFSSSGTFKTLAEAEHEDSRLARLGH